MSRSTEHKKVSKFMGLTRCSHCGKVWDSWSSDEVPSCEPVVQVPPRPTGLKLNSKPFKLVEHVGGHIPTSAVRPPPPNRQSAGRVERTPGHIAIIGFLTAKLACYEPDSDIVKRAMEYLKDV